MALIDPCFATGILSPVRALYCVQRCTEYGNNELCLKAVTNRKGKDHFLRLLKLAFAEECPDTFQGSRMRQDETCSFTGKEDPVVLVLLRNVVPMTEEYLGTAGEVSPYGNYPCALTPLPQR